MATQRSRRVVLFGLIGVLNTLIDFAVYLTVMHFVESIVVANIVATSVALCVSFVLNSQLTFQIGALSARRFAAFLGVTLFGLWVLQTSIIYGLTPVVAALPVSLFALFGSAALLVERLLPKLLATSVTLVWNYLWYSHVIFNTNSSNP